MTNPRASVTPVTSIALKYGVLGAAAILLFCIAAFEYLNFAGYCYRDKRFFTDHELIAVAASREVMINKAYAQFEQRITYESPEALMARNPDCCLVTRSDTTLLQESTWSRIFGSYVLLVEVMYRAKENGDKPFYSDVHFLSACGEILDRAGSEEATSKPITSP
jgi:hypothetical protein